MNIVFYVLEVSDDFGNISIVQEVPEHVARNAHPGKYTCISTSGEDFPIEITTGTTSYPGAGPSAQQSGTDGPSDQPEGSSSSRHADNPGSSSSSRGNRQQGDPNLGTPSRTRQQFDVPVTVESGYAVFRSASPTLSPDNPEAKELAKQKAIEELKSQLESLQVNPAQAPRLTPVTNLSLREFLDVQDKEKRYQARLTVSKQPPVLLGTCAAIQNTKDRLPEHRPFSRWVRLRRRENVQGYEYQLRLTNLRYVKFTIGDRL